MIKKTITYEDFDGNKVTEDFWFQLTKAEVVEKAMVEGDGYLEKLQALSVSQNGKEIMSIFKTLLGEAVGRREGNLFVKNEEIRKQFMYSGAYDAFFMELLTTPDSGATFIRGMLPKDAHEAIDEALAEQGIKTPTPAQPTEFPKSLEAAVEANAKTEEKPELQAAAPQLAPSTNENQPVWLREQREPTQKEMLQMSKEELALAFRLKGEGLLNRQNKPAS